MNRSKIYDSRWWLCWLEAGSIGPKTVIPESCNQEVFSKGIMVGKIAQGSGARCWDVEALIVKVARQSGTVGKTDWHYSGGIAQVLTLGDVGKVGESLRALWPAFVRQWPDSMIEIGGQPLYRAGVTHAPPDALGFDSTSGAFLIAQGQG